VVGRLPRWSTAGQRLRHAAAVRMVDIRICIGVDGRVDGRLVRIPARVITGFRNRERWTPRSTSRRSLRVARACSSFPDEPRIDEDGLSLRFRVARPCPQTPVPIPSTVMLLLFMRLTRIPPLPSSSILGRSIPPTHQTPHAPLPSTRMPCRFPDLVARTVHAHQPAPSS
jgi:hypothetical protein